jgi:glycosyltransferase involved in cell wall biosynthesis
MRWLIVEDALRDRKGHWFEYIGTFSRELCALGDDVTILADRSAESFLIKQLQVQPVLPNSIWHRMGDGAGALRRYLRVPVHAWKTYRTLKKYLRRGDKFDVIFVPTVLVHHLLGWTWLIKHVLKQTDARVLLFFPNTPVQLDLKTNEPSWQPAPTAKLFCWLIRSLKKEVAQGRVILGAETHPMRDALTQLTGVLFTYFPHPVQETNTETLKAENQKSGLQSQVSGLPSPSLITMGSYGSARHEKGSDLLVSAVGEYCRRYPESRARFVLQSVDGDGKLWERLKGNSKARLIPNYFADGEYARQLRATDVLLLPYRRSSYDLRVSRVVIEGMVQGIPIVTTQGTTLEDQAKKFGAAFFFENGNLADLISAIRKMEEHFTESRELAKARKISAQRHFSVREFRSTLTKFFTSN